MATFSRRGFIAALAATAACCALPALSPEKKELEDFAQKGDTVWVPNVGFEDERGMRVPVTRPDGTLRTYITVVKVDTKTNTIWLA